jgi:hypothetical protein
MSNSQRRSSPATAHNRGPILEVLQQILPSSGLVLEISSGAGEHAAFFSRHFPALIWQPSDVDESALESIEAWRSEGSENLRSPIRLDATSPAWPVTGAVAVLNINMIHIAPWSACQGLMRGAEEVLASGGLLYLYGPYQIDGEHTAPSNAAFDASLKSRDPSWGIRDMAGVSEEAQRRGLRLEQKIAMPANNFSLIFRRD